MINLTELREKAKRATQGFWPERIWTGPIEWFDGMRPTIIPHGPLQLSDKKGNERAIWDAEHISAFRPEVALEFLDRLEKAEAQLARSEERRKKLREAAQ